MGKNFSSASRNTYFAAAGDGLNRDPAHGTGAVLPIIAAPERIPACDVADCGVALLLDPEARTAMTHPQPRSSLAIALQDYHHILGVRPGLALTVAAIALIAAAGLAIGLITMLGSSSRSIAEGRQTVRALHRYNAALEVWRQMSAQPDSAL